MIGSIRIVFDKNRCALLEVDGVNMLKGCSGVEITMTPLELPEVVLKYVSSNIFIECSEASIKEDL